MNEGVTIKVPIHFTTGQCGQRVLNAGAAPPAIVEAGTIPRLARLMALAIHIEELVRTREVEDYASIAELSHVSRARVSQIVNLLNLAPDIQEAVLFLSPVAGERDAVSERAVRKIASEPDWGVQREMWNSICGIAST